MPLTQTEIGEHLAMSQAAAGDMLRRLGIDWNESTLDDIRVAYIRHLREIAAGRAGSGDLDLASERAMLARSQRERIDLANAVTRRELAPVILIEQVLARAGSKVAGILDGIPGMIKRRVARLTAAEISLIAAEIARARNIAAALRLEDIIEAAPAGCDRAADDEATDGQSELVG
ncbi:terminase small subunit [Accumulibacter sp.]|uniref:terminase small subunit n=1 Tax=Accumulibacter sp. TaxID=2053492 RepID=UPI00258F1E80|nr:terminase small subunit [Accumulibacter sp.]